MAGEPFFSAEGAAFQRVWGHVPTEPAKRTFWWIFSFLF